MTLSTAQKKRLASLTDYWQDFNKRYEATLNTLVELGHAEQRRVRGNAGTYAQYRLRQPAE